MLYLHIGSMKTGSTAIQSFIGSEIETSFGHRQMQSLGLGQAWKLNLALIDNYQYLRGCNFWRDRPDADFKSLKDSLFSDLRSEIASGPDRRFVASSEHLLSQFQGENPERIGALKDELLDIFGDVRIIVYLRDQRDFIKSWYSQFLKGSSTMTLTFEEFVDTLPDREWMWNYSKPLKVWSDAFGSDRIRVSIFDKRALHEGDLLKDFLYHIDADPDEIDDRKIDHQKRENVSPTFAQLKAIRRISKLPGHHHAIHKKALRRLFVNAHTRRFGQTSFPDTFDQNIVKLASDGNEWINRIFLDGATIKLPTQPGSDNE